jgi:protein TonB
MIKKSSTFISGVLAFTAYFIIIGLLIFYFNTRSEDKSKHFVKKDEHRIQVALSAPKKVTAPKTKSKKKPKIKPKKKHRTKPKPKKTSKKKVIKEKVVKKKIVKKKDQNITKPKKQAKDLFKNIKTSKKKKLKIQVSDKPIENKSKNNLIKVSSMSASERINASLKSQKRSDSGVENAYFAKVQRMLEEWPAQSDYAGEKAKVILYIEPSGFFKFRIVSQSGIPAFNRGLEEFLEQLQVEGFGPHNAGRTYKFEAEFIAKD